MTKKGIEIQMIKKQKNPIQWEVKCFCPTSFWRPEVIDCPKNIFPH